MNRHQLAPAAGVGVRNGGPPPSVTSQPSAAITTIPRTRSVADEASFAPISVSVRTHTLILTGQLNGGSVLAFEAEIERLCDEGVSGITLDLRELEAIDAIGVAVIAFRSGLCQRRGCEFTLIRGPRSVDLAFERAGVNGSLRYIEVDSEVEAEAQAERRPALVLSAHAAEVGEP